MSEWRWTNWGELGVLHYGKALRGYQGGSGPVEVFGTNGPIGWTDAQLFPPGVIVGRKGAYRGIHYAKGPCWVIDTAYWLETNAETVDSRWAYWQLRTVDLNAIDSGSAIPSTSRDAFAQIPVHLPPLTVQRGVAAVLDSFDELIENNRRRIELLEEMARAIYREWFVHFRYPGHEAVPLVDSPLGQIPDGWHVRPSSEVLEINPRVPLPRGTRCRHMTMGDLDERVMNCEPSGWKDSPSGSKFVNGDTLFARITPCLENGKTGFVQALDDGEAACGSTEFVVLRGRLVGPTFTYLLARSDDFRGHAISSMSGASGRQRVRNECFDSVLVATPPEEIAAAFESVARPLFSLSWSLHCEATKLASLRDLLLPKLVTGQIDVTRLDLDELVEEAVSA